MRPARRVLALLCAALFLPTAVEAGACLEAVAPAAAHAAHAAASGAVDAPTAVTAHHAATPTDGATASVAGHDAHADHAGAAVAPTAASAPAHGPAHGPHDCCPPNAGAAHCLVAAGCLTAAPTDPAAPPAPAPDASGIRAAATSAPPSIAPRPGHPTSERLTRRAPAGRARVRSARPPFGAWTMPSSHRRCPMLRPFQAGAGPSRRARSASARRSRPALAALAALLAAPSAALAQTDYLNLDAGRPLRVEDATAVEWRAVEVQFAPVSLERAAPGAYAWGVEPELAVGILPRTHLSVGLPIAALDVAGGSTTGVAGVHAGLFHQLNLETRLPAIALTADVLLPVGSLGPSRAWPTLGAVVTRTLPAFGPLRVHAMGRYTFGERDAADAAGAAEEVARWIAGIAVDRALPLRFMTIGAELVARRGVDADDVAWTTSVGVRRQVTPRLLVDAGIGRRVAGDAAPWSVTVGSARAFGLGGRPF